MREVGRRTIRRRIVERLSRLGMLALVSVSLTWFFLGADRAGSHQDGSHSLGEDGAVSDVRARISSEISPERGPLASRRPERTAGQVLRPVVTTMGSEFLFLNLLGEPRAGIDPSEGVSLLTSAGRIRLLPSQVDAAHLVPVRMRDSATVLYRDAFKDTDLALTPTAAGLNVLFRRKSPAAPYNHEWRIAGPGETRELGTAMGVSEAMDIADQFSELKQAIADEPATDGSTTIVRPVGFGRGPGDDAEISLDDTGFTVTLAETEGWSGFTVDTPWAWRQPWRAQGGELTRPVGGGLLKQKGADGEVFYSHGADRFESPDGTAQSTAGYNCIEYPSGWCYGKPPDFTPMNPACATGNTFAVLYAYTTTPINNDIKYRIRQILRDVTGRLNMEHQSSGGVGTRLKVRCNENQVPSVWQFKSESGASLSSHITDAWDNGYRDATTKWLIFTERASGIGAEGQAAVTPDDFKSVFNWNNIGNANGEGPNPIQGYAISWRGYWGDGDHQAGVVPLHEAAHLMGAVAYSAPQTNNAYHCRASFDVMCQPDPAPALTMFPYVSCYRERFDCGKLNYFSGSPAPGSYLATHWNLGEAENLYLSRP